MFSKKWQFFLSLGLLAFVFYSCRNTSEVGVFKGLKKGLFVYTDASMSTTLDDYNAELFDISLLGEGGSRRTGRLTFTKRFPALVFKNFYAPGKHRKKKGVLIDWESSDPTTLRLRPTGGEVVVTRPGPEEMDKVVTLTATMKRPHPKKQGVYQFHSSPKVFKFLVLREKADFSDVLESDEAGFIPLADEEGALAFMNEYYIPQGPAPTLSVEVDGKTVYRPIDFGLVPYTPEELFTSYLKDYRDTRADLVEKMTHVNEIMTGERDRAHPDLPPLIRLPGVAGLRNCGNTCFMNSISQILLHTPYLRAYLDYMVPENFPGDPGLEFVAPVTHALKGFFDGYYAKVAAARAPGPDHLAPDRFPVYEPIGGAFLARLHDTLHLNNGGRQEDAADFFQALLQALNREYYELTGSPESEVEVYLPDKVVPEKTFENPAEALKQAFFSWGVNFSWNKSYVSPMISSFGTLVLEYKSFFSKENPEELKRTIDLNLSPFAKLPIPQGRGEARLEDLFDLQDESGAPLVPFKFAHGERAQTHSKWLFAGKYPFAENVPAYLAIQLKRFDFARGRKIQRPVRYPARFTRDGVTYELYGVSHHSGGLGGGHYWADVKVGDSWFNCNDSSVRPLTDQDVFGSGESANRKKKTAYLLFYKVVEADDHDDHDDQDDQDDHLGPQGDGHDDDDVPEDEDDGDDEDLQDD